MISKFEHIPLFLQNRINVNLVNLLFISILTIGIFARVWEFGLIPPGLNLDETSIGIEAYSIYHYGLDRNGISFPVHLISWGGGQNALYAYVIIPFIAIWGLSAVTIRLPMLISGILALPLMYYVGKRILDKNMGLISMFLLAISPWHIILSRWGLESNIFPFLFLVGFACLLKSMENSKWFIVACVFFALCLYAYGPAYLAIPVFLTCALPVLIYYKKSSLKNTSLGLVVFTLITTPIILFIIVNTFRLSTIHIGPLTAPRMPAQARYELLAAVFNRNPFASLSANALGFLKLLVIQSDGLLWNVLDPYGYFYTITFPLALTEAIFLIPTRKRATNKAEKLLLLSWLIASVSIGVMQPANINRINLIFIPLILCISVFLVKLYKNYKHISLVAICLFLIGFIGFTLDYHGDDFRKHANELFYEGLIPALNVAKQEVDAPICVTDTVHQIYIYVLYSEKMNPADYANTIQWVDYRDPFRDTHTLGRYKFGLNNCPNDPKTIYVLTMKEEPPDNGLKYEIRVFTEYRVFLPRNTSD
jgi:asparagine N-glycosylation enzyme membrane subunit Stt3